MRWPGIDAEDQVAIDEAMIALDGTPNKSQPWRQCHSRRVARRCEGRGGCQRPAAVSLCRRHAGAGSAGADDEHPERRRSCRQSDRFSGIHDPALRRAVVEGSGALGRRSLPGSEKRAEEGRPQHQCRRRRRLCAQSSVGRGGARFLPQGRSKAPASSPARTSRLALDCAATRVLPRRRLSL